MCVFVADNNAQTFSLTVAEAEKKISHVFPTKINSDQTLHSLFVPFTHNILQLPLQWLQLP